MSEFSKTAEIADTDAREVARLISQLESQSAAGDGEATRQIATVEAVGAGRPQNWKRALDALQLAAEQGSDHAQKQLRLLANGEDDSDWAAVRAAIDIDSLLSAPERISLSDSPRIRSAPGFATPRECQWLIDAARARLRHAEVWDPAKGSGRRDNRRSNSAMEFRLFDLDVVIQVVRARIATITRLPVPVFEVPQVLHYSVGEIFAPHHDYLDPSDPGNSEHLAGFGQRIATFLLYLNEAFDGGETDFPRAGVSYRGRTGDALFFANVRPDGTPDPATLHAGTAPAAGEKWILSQWIRDRVPSPTAEGQFHVSMRSKPEREEKSKLELNEALDAINRGDLDGARALAEQALKETPSPQWHHLLGIVHCRLGDPGQGAEHLRQAFEAEPTNAGYQVMFTRALIDAGRAEEVLAMPEPPPIRSVQDLALWQARGEAADVTGEAEAAIDAWSRITAAAPSDWRAWGSLAKSLAGQKRWQQAADAFVEAATLNSAEPSIRADAVAALVEAGRHHQRLLHFEQAEATLRRAYQLDPTNPLAVHHLGLSLERTNRVDELKKLVDDALSRGVSQDSLSYLRALLAWREGRPKEALNLLGEMDARRDPVVWTLRAKIADSIGDSEAAVEAATAMNRAAIDRAVRPEDRDEWERNARAYREEQRQLARTIRPEWASDVPTLSEAPPQPVSFLVGFPRSGTTLLDTFLLGHPKIDVLEEKQLIGAARQVTGPIENLPSVSIELLQQARRTYFDRLREYVDPGVGGLVIDKFPLDMAAAPLIHAIFPGAPIIFMQRHPCDVVLSGFLQPFGIVNFSDIEVAADYYDAMMSIWIASREALPLNVHTVLYEELVRDPEGTLRPTVDFLGLEWDDRILDHQRTAKERGTIVTPSYDQVTKPVTGQQSGRWKRYTKQLEPVLPLLLAWAERLGYAD